MMHHPNMHHQPMSGHPPQHMPGHQAMPAHHQMPPHQLHRENRHVTLTRVPLGPSQAGGGMGGHGQAMGGMGSMGVPPHHGPAQRPPHPIRPMPHHPPGQHHNVPPRLRRPYMGGGYGPGGVVPPPFQHHHPPTQPAQQTQNAPPRHTVAAGSVSAGPVSGSAAVPEASANVGAALSAGGADCAPAAGDGEARAPAAAANSKEKTPMCLVNELARYNKIKHQYRLTSETGPAHKKVFTVTLRLGEAEEYTAEGSSIKRAQHAAAGAALAGTAYPPPPPRPAPPLTALHHHHRNSGTVMPTVELNALAMKLCQPAIYTSLPAVAGCGRGARGRGYGGGVFARVLPALVYRVRVDVGGRAWLGEGATPQAARHDAAARALHDLRPHPAPVAAALAPHDTNAATDENGEGGDLLNSEVKSPVSLVHEIALKRNLTVDFAVKSERGPPHMRVFVTTCTVGEIETEGEGNGKKVSKRRAAERMLEEMRHRWPLAALRPRPPERRRPHPAKKKPRNLIKEGSVCSGSGGGSPGGDNPISRLAVVRHAARARSPHYAVLEERGAARRREFLVRCDAPPHSATGRGPNKKTAKRRAAHNVLLAMEMITNGSTGNTATVNGSELSTSVSSDGSKSNGTDSKNKVSDTAASETRQPVPGVLLMDYQQRGGTPQTQTTNGVTDTVTNSTSNSTPVVSNNSTTTSPGTTPGAKDQLMYLSQLLGFTVQFSDFPKRNHGEYLSLVSLSTEPPVMCHGGGASTAHSHEQCARAALRALALMGLDAPDHAAVPSTPSKPSVAITNGVTE